LQARYSELERKDQELSEQLAQSKAKAKDVEDSLQKRSGAQRIKVAKAIPFCAWAFLPNRTAEMVATVLPEGYDPKSRFATKGNTDDADVLEEARLLGAVWELREVYFAERAMTFDALNDVILNAFSVFF
jgi:hypothetical protein